MINHTSPPSREAIAGLEPFVGLGRESIRVIATAQEAAMARDELMRNKALGFDTESRPTFRRGEKSEGPHVVQFATLQKAYLFQPHQVECRAVIAELLESSHITKIGFSLKSDIHRLSNKFSIRPRAIVDLDDTFKSLGYRNEIGAKTAIAILFNRRFSKSKHLTTSNWSNEKLSEKQILYAANDAYAAITVFHALH